jgi:hypothetical protein
LLLQVPIGLWWGFSSVVQNAGKVQNKGVELSVNANVVKSNNFSYNTSLVFAYNKQVNVSLAPGITSIAFNTANPSGVVSAQQFTKLEPGKELGLIYGYKYAGVIKTGETYAPQPNAQPGDPKYLDVNNDGQITPDDRTYLGNTIPHYTAGFDNELYYKGISLNIFFQGAFGYHLYNMNRLIMESTTGTDVLNRWVAGTNENTSIPREGYFLSQYGSYVNSRFVEDASYVRLKSVTLSYSLPAKLFQRIQFIEGLKIYATGQNLLTFTKYTGSDPESNVRANTTFNSINNTANNIGGGLDFGTFPGFRTFVVGAKISLH